jgi:hypothetical protein
MSRYILPPRTPGLVVIVGWDPPLETFFGQVLNRWAASEEDQCLAWVGARARAIPTVEQLEALLSDYAHFTETWRARLRLDRETSPRPRRLPRVMRMFV